MVSALIPVGGPDQERICFHLEQLVAISRSGGNSAKNIAKIRIENRPLPDAPPAAKLRNHLRLEHDLASERSVFFKPVIAALILIHIPPVAQEVGMRPVFQVGAGSQREKQKKRKKGFHLQTRAARLTRGREERNQRPSPKKESDPWGRIALSCQTNPEVQFCATSADVARNFLAPA